MSDRSYDEDYDDRRIDHSERHPPLPTWLADRVLQDDEKVTWVYGPSRNPALERLITHPALFLLALLLGGFCLGTGRLIAGSWSGMPIPAALAAFVIVFGSIFLLAISSAYFTRLVVTNYRLLILQGHEVCRSWNIDDLPSSLLRYGMRGSRESPSVDLDALKTMLGSSSDQITEPKSILALGKQLDRIKNRHIDRDRDRDRD